MHSKDAVGLTVKNMRTFFWLARLQNYHAVARHLNVTQPAITSRIGALEDELGVKLFFRDKKPVELTPEGREALKLCEQVLQGIDGIVERFSAPADQLRGAAHIGVVDTVARTWLPAVLNRVQRTLPDVALEITNEGTLELHALLKAGSLSMCITIQECNFPDIRNSEIGRYDIEWVANPQLVDPDRTYSIQELTQFPLIGYVPQSPPDNLLRRYLGRHYSSLGIRNTTNSMSTMIWLAEKGVGIAAIPPSAIHQQIADNRLTVIRTEHRFEPMSFYLNCRERPYSPVSQVIEGLVREEARKFAPPSPKGDVAR